MGLPVMPELVAGDLLIHVETLLHGLRGSELGSGQRLLNCGYVSAKVRPSLHAVLKGDTTPPPEWAAELTSAEQALLHAPDRADALPIVRSDGKNYWLEDEPGVFHPSIYCRDPNSEIDVDEVYFRDLCGHLVVPDLMDPEWLAVANATIERHTCDLGQGGSAAGESKSLAGSGLSNLNNPWTLPGNDGEPFRRVFAHPAVVQRLNWMMGSGYECTINSAFCSKKGSSGHFLHAGGEPPTVSNHYRLQNGRTYCEFVNCVTLRRTTVVTPAYRAVTRAATPRRMVSKLAMPIWTWYGM